ncbi:MAG: TIGR03118 family protein, partial [Thermoanaerobaculia bacterium]
MRDPFARVCFAAKSFLFAITIAASISSALAAQPNVKADEVPNIAPGSAYIQTNLASDVNGLAQTLDPQLINPWGIAIRGTSPFWTANNAASSSSLLRVDPVTDATIINPSPSHISIPGGLPTGVVGNSTSDFQITPPGGGTPAAAIFIFDSITGNITAWNGASGASAQSVVSMPGHVWTGLAIGANGGGNRLYAADFANNHIDVFDGTYTATTVTGGFIDATIPAGYAPFNIQNLGGSLFVTYAKVGGDGEAENGIGNGFVRKFNTDGVRDLTFAINNGALDAPWGVAIAPASFGIFGGALIVGNFSDFGTIHAYNPSTGAFLGTLQDPGGDPIVIDELWGLQFGNDGNGGDVDAMYFTAGIAEESHGLFGVLRPTTAASTTLIRFTSDQYSVFEPQGSINITVFREGDTSGSATVNYAPLTGSGTGFASGSDFTLAPGTLTFAPGETVKILTVTVANDGGGEGDETLELVLSNPTNAQLATPSTATLTISDSAPVPNIAPGSAYIQTNLASDVNGIAQTLDPQLINPWGIAIRGTSPFWTANNAASSSSLLRVDPVTDATIINPSPSHISIPGGLPTGVVGNTTSDFQITPPGGGT